MPCCGFCRKTGHNKNSCEELTKQHERLSIKATKEDFIPYNTEQLKMILQKALGTQPFEKHKNQIQNELYNIYVKKTGYHNLQIPVQPKRERLTRDDEVASLILKTNELLKRSNEGHLHQQFINKFPSNLHRKLYKTSLEKKECPICYTENSTNCETDCEHSYCLNCISNSLKYKPLCAICRNKIEWICIDISENII
jgi:hypothetical protein